MAFFEYCTKTPTSILVTISSIMIMTGCGPDETPPELPHIGYKLIITDSIGVELGDAEYLLGWPVSPTHSPDGNIVFVDRKKPAAFIYTPEGEFIRSVGREGEGPGEFHMPMVVSFRSDGSMIIGDGVAITMFDSNYEYQDQMIWPFFHPYIITALDSGGFVGKGTDFLPEDDKIMIVSTLARWDGDEDPSVEYFSIEFEFIVPDGVSDRSNSREHNIICCATRDGRVFYSQSSIDKFVIHGCEPDGSPFIQIVDENFHRVRKSEDELQTEIDAFNSWVSLMSGGSGRTLEMKPDPYRRTILGMFTDGGERLWVRLGSHPGIVFRVYDFSGEILFHAMVEYEGNPTDLNSWEITGDEHGFLAINTSHEYYQRVYMLTLVENE